MYEGKMLTDTHIWERHTTQFNSYGFLHRCAFCSFSLSHSFFPFPALPSTEFTVKSIFLLGTRYMCLKHDMLHAQFQTDLHSFFSHSHTACGSVALILDFLRLFFPHSFRYHDGFYFAYGYFFGDCFTQTFGCVSNPGKNKRHQMKA